MKFILINRSIPVISTFILSIIVSQPAEASRLNGSFSFMGNSSYFETRSKECMDEAKMKGVPKLDMITIDASFSIKKDPFAASDSFIKFTWSGSDCEAANKRYSNYLNSGMPWMSRKIALTEATMFNTETWALEKIAFAGRLDGFGSSSGFFDFTTGTGMTESRTTSSGTLNDITTIFKITNLQAVHCPIERGNRLLSFRSYAPFSSDKKQKIYTKTTGIAEAFLWEHSSFFGEG